MRTALVSVAALAATLLPHSSFAATCSDRSPAAITTVAAASRACQETLAAEGSKFFKTQAKALSKCKQKMGSKVCPDARTTDKILKAAQKAKDKIAGACGTDAAQQGLTSSYAALTDDAVLSSCMLSQHSVEASLVSAWTTGATTETWPGTGSERDRCVKELAKGGVKFADRALKNANKCIAQAMQAGTPGDLAALCVGGFSGGTFVPGSDQKTAAKQVKHFTKTEDKLDKKCAAVEALDQIATLFACPGATTVEDLKECVVCNGWNAVLDVLEQQYSENATYVANGPDAVQNAVDAASVGDKLLIGEGTYQEEVVITTDGLKLVGCGAATDDRPHFIPTTPSSGRGIQSDSVDDLLFQSLSLFGHQNDHIRNSNGNNLTYRDIRGDGNADQLTNGTDYAIFPIRSENVLAELNVVRRQDDAPIYVGQSATIVVRFNDVRDGVAGIEIENSGNAEVYGNYGTNNTAGLLVFRDPDLTPLTDCHTVHHNLFEDNNTPNFGSGTVGQVPAGTGIIVISSKHSEYHHNLARNNDTFGIAFTDQSTAEFCSDPGDPDLNQGCNFEQQPEDNFIYSNVFLGNGTNPDFAFGFDAFALYGVLQPPPQGPYPGTNCASDNITTNASTSNLNVMPACILPPDFSASCPVPLPPAP